MWRCLSQKTSAEARCLSRRFSSQGALHPSGSPQLVADAPPALPLSIGRVQSRRAWEKLHTKRKVDGGSSKSKSKEDDKPWPKNVVYGAAGVASVVVPYTLVWITVSVPWMRTSLLSKSQVESLRRHFGTPEPHHVAYTEALNGEGATDPRLVPSVLPGEGSPRDEAAAEAIQRRLEESVRVELAAISSSGPPSIDGQPPVAICLTLPASERANQESLRQRCRDIAPLGGDPWFVAVNFPDEGSDEENVDVALMHRADSTDELGDEFGAARGLDPLVGNISIYSTWYYQPPLTNAGSQRSSNHPVTGQFTNEELQVRHLEAEVARLQAELTDRNTTRPFDDIREDLDRCRAQLRRLKRRRWVPWL